MVSYTLKYLGSINWIAKSDLYLSMSNDENAENSEDAEDDLIDIPENIKIIPDILTNERLEDVINSLFFFMYNERLEGMPSNFYDYIRKQPVKDFNKFLSFYKEKDRDEKWKKVMFLKEFNSTHKDNLCNWTAKNGYLDCLIYAHQNGCPWDKNTCKLASKNGHLECLMYLHQNGCPWDVESVHETVKGGHLDCLMYLHKNGCYILNSIDYAAAHGHLDCLIYLNQNGCTWLHSTTFNVVRYGWLDCIKYGLENAFQWKDWITYWAAVYDHLDVIVYAYENGHALTPDIRALASKHQRIIDYLDSVNYTQ